MSIHVLCDNVPHYAVQPVLPMYRGNNNDNFKHRLFNSTGASARASLEERERHAPVVYSASITLSRVAGGAVTGAPGVGGNRDVWM